MRWSLEDYYHSFKDAAFLEDLEKLEKIITGFEQKVLPDITGLSKQEIAGIIEQQLRDQAELSNLMSRLMGFCSLTMSVETTNTTALSYMQKIQQKSVRLTKSSVRFMRWLAEVADIDDVITCSEFLIDHKFKLHETLKHTRYLLSEKEEDIIARLSLTGSTAWSRMKSHIESQHLVRLEEDGETKEYPLPVIRNMAHAADEEKRKKAYEAELASYDQIAYPACSALNAIKGEVLEKVKMRGYDSVIDMTLINSRLEKQTLDTMLAAIKENLPHFQKYLRHKAKLLGNDNGLPFYNLFAPLGEVNKEFSFSEARDFIVKHFGQFSTKLADFADHAFEHNWIDAEPRKGKRGGAFCSTCHAIGQSRILANFSGNLGDVTTLAHELGHAYHGACLKEESVLNASYSMPVAETASIFAETIVKDAVMQAAQDEEKLAILEAKLMESTQVIVDIYSRYLFESRFIEARKNGDVSLDDTKNMMLQAQKEAYGDGLDHEFLHPYMWLCKPHYYYAGSNFYNFPYAFGLLFALGLYARFLEDRKGFLKKYDDILRETGRNSITGVAAFAGIDINSKEFWRDSLDLIKSEIDEFLKF